MELILHILLFISSFFPFIYGISCYFKKKKPLFNQIITCAIGCMSLGRLYDLITFLVNGKVNHYFTLGMLGILGGFMFLFSASYGQMDGLVDGKEKGLLKYRLLALLAPLSLATIYVFIVLSFKNFEDYFPFGIIFIFMMQASYFNFKHLIIPDVEYGILKSIRLYNLIALLLSIFSALELLGKAIFNDYLRFISLICIIVLYLVMIPILKRGSIKWTI